MKRYAESKAKVQLLEQASADKVSDAGKSIQSKESELLSLRLKIENFERTTANQKDESEDLKDKGINILPIRSMTRVLTNILSHLQLVSCSGRLVAQKVR